MYFKVIFLVINHVPCWKYTSWALGFLLFYIIVQNFCNNMIWCSWLQCHFFPSLSHTIFSVCWCSYSSREIFTQIIPLSMKDWKLKLDVKLPLRPKDMCHGTSVFNALSEDPRHLHLFPSVFHWNCHYMFNLLRTVAGGESTPVLLHARETPRSQKTRFFAE